jgi:mannose-6-phosphate isomerase-like protein (cupin superfamily)
MADPKIVQKPWGDYQDIFRTTNVVFKKITIRPGEAFSYQRHQKRAEFWFVQQGEGLVKISDVIDADPMKTFRVEPLQTWTYILVPAGMAHQVTNTGTENLILYEMQCGAADEEDITRYDDKYGRA